MICVIASRQHFPDYTNETIDNQQIIALRRVLTYVFLKNDFLFLKTCFPDYKKRLSR